MRVEPCCRVFTKDDPANYYAVDCGHYESLRDRLDCGEKGWIELNSHVADGRLFVRLENISGLFLSTQGHCDAVNEENEASLLE